MLKTRYLGALVVGCIIVSSAFGQDADDKKGQRRERLKKLAEIGAGIATEAAASDGEVVSGNVITLQGKPSEKAQEVNVGGLVVVRIADSGNRPPKEIVVEEHREQFQRIGQVRGVAKKKGKPQDAGGFTWVLLKPTKEGEGEILVSITRHDGNKVQTVYNVLVTSVEKTTEAVAEDATDSTTIDGTREVEEEAIDFYNYRRF